MYDTPNLKDHPLGKTFLLENSKKITHLESLFEHVPELTTVVEQVVCGLHPPMLHDSAQ